MNNIKVAKPQKSNSLTAKQDELTNTLQDEALDRPAAGISVQCGCFPFCFSPGSPN